MHIYFVTRISRAAEKAMEVFQKMRSGDKFEAKQRKRKKMKNEMSLRKLNLQCGVISLYVLHMLIKARSHQQTMIKMSSIKLDWERKREDINITQSQFKDIIIVESFPKLEAGGGFRFLKG